MRGEDLEGHCRLYFRILGETKVLTSLHIRVSHLEEQMMIAVSLQRTPEHAEIGKVKG